MKRKFEIAIRCNENFEITGVDVSANGGNVVTISNTSSFSDMKKAVKFEMVRQNSLFNIDHQVREQYRKWDPRHKITTPDHDATLLKKFPKKDQKKTALEMKKH